MQRENRAFDPLGLHYILNYFTTQYSQKNNNARSFAIDRLSKHSFATYKMLHLTCLALFSGIPQYTLFSCFLWHSGGELIIINPDTDIFSYLTYNSKCKFSQFIKSKLIEYICWNTFVLEWQFYLICDKHDNNITLILVQSMYQHNYK